MNNTRQIGIAVVIAIIIGIVFYVAGYWHAESRAEMNARQLTGEVHTLQVTLTTTENRDRILRARVSLCRAAGDMDQRNFGMANGHLKEASTALAAVDAGAAGVDAVQLGILRGQLDSFNVNVAEDLEAQRSRILELGKQLDMLIPAPIPAGGTTAPTAPAAPTAPTAPATVPAGQ